MMSQSTEEEMMVAPRRTSFFMRGLIVLLAGLGLLGVTSLMTADDPRQHPLSAEDRETLRKEWETDLAGASKALEKNPDDVSQLAKRGDLYFFRGEFAKSVRDYERMSELDPTLDASHWRLGIAYFYADQPEKSAAQFDKFFVSDDVDREAGLWKYIAEAPTIGAEKARARLHKYQKEDREPLPTIYRLFEEEISPEDLRKSVSGKLSQSVREQRMFYIELYLGFWHDAHNRPKEALPHFRAATANKWGRTAGFGPNYMWHVARLHYERLLEKQKP